MNDKSLYEKILGVQSPWHVDDVVIDFKAGTITIKVVHGEGSHFGCPECKKPKPIHDHRIKRWRHLPTCQLRTIIEAKCPRTSCEKHGIHMIHVPWADGNSKFTAIFESLVINWLKEASITAVTRLMDLSWDQVDTIRSHAVKRGLARRQAKPVRAIGIDETSFQKRHEYVTVIVDQDTSTVVDLLDDRKQESLQNYMKALPVSHREQIETVSMDMWDPYIAAIRETVEEWKSKICFDRYHVSSHFGKALDKVRSAEHRQFMAETGESILTKTRHDWLRNSSRTDNRSRREFMALTRKNLKTSRAWSIKETAADLWVFFTRGHAENGWNRLIRWMKKSRLQPMIKLSRTITNYLWGIINAIKHQVTNGKSEAINGRIQWIKKMACGFRNRKRFRDAILFHLGGLNLMPKYYHPTHLKA
jgi:transposase